MIEPVGNRILDGQIIGPKDKRVGMMKEYEGPPVKRRPFFSTAIVLIWTITMLAVALFLMSIVVVQLGVK